MITHSKLFFFFISACEFNCEADGYCITNYTVCDGYTHCSDGQDEQNCGTLPVFENNTIASPSNREAPYDIN